MPVALVTGVFGQDGSLLAELLLERGYRVVGIARPGAVGDAALRARIDVIELDLAAQAGLDWATSIVARNQPDEIYHLAACHRSSEPGLRDDPAQQQRMIAVNHTAALALAHALVARGRGRLVVAGSSQMYAPALPVATVDETTPHAPPTFYGVTKGACRDALGWLRRYRELGASMAILFNHESPRRSSAFVSRKITLAAARIAAGLERELVLGDLCSRVDFSSAHDIVEGLHAMALAPAADYVLGSGTLCRIDELCERAFAANNLDWRDHVRSTQAPNERPALVADPRAAIRELGWSPRRDLATWIGEMVAADRARLASP